ncbi:caspase family protein [Vibrio sp. 10N.261.55.A7]|uniref:caspase family protein n=1 Tax=Vibrio sp. 10N.261.55.A7 TaxID=1880851 RepID=UPI0018E48322|nr:caspase family protein [Vibrio sp. 10N.261.55.A7]
MTLSIMPRMTLQLLVAILFVCTSISSWASGGDRQALIIGNANYQIGALKNPVNDAKALAGSLEKLGFSVTLLTDADKRKMQQAIRSYSKSLKPDDVNLFYYAGHGVQQENRNYLIPLSAQIETAADVEYESVMLDFVLDTFAQAKNRQNIILLDACRNNPYKSESRGLRRGLAQTDGPKGTFIAYATAPGAVALDGQGEHGVFTGALLEHIDQQGLSLEQVFKQTLAQVNKETQGKQVPWISSSFYEDFYFAGKQAPSTTVSYAVSSDLNSASQQGDAQSNPASGSDPNLTALTMRSNIYYDEVFIDGRSYGATPFSLTLPKGDYEISVLRDGFKTWQQVIKLSRTEQVVWAQMQRQIKMVSYKNGDRFVGTLVDKKKSGKGLYIYSKDGQFAGDRFYGEYEKGQRHGFGTYIASSGERYVGAFENGKRNGTGTLNFANGDQYYGDFLNGQRSGTGSLIYRNGDTYYGEFTKGVRDGWGVYTFSNGSEYKGPFVQGIRHGNATCISAEKTEVVCRYDNGKRVAIQ